MGEYQPAGARRGEPGSQDHRYGSNHYAADSQRKQAHNQGDHTDRYPGQPGALAPFFMDSPAC